MKSKYKLTKRLLSLSSKVVSPKGMEVMSEYTLLTLSYHGLTFLVPFVDNQRLEVVFTKKGHYLVILPRQSETPFSWARLSQ